MLSMKTLVQEFLFDCQARNLAPRTIHNYQKQLNYFLRYLKEAQGVEALEDLHPVHIKQFIVMLQGKKNKPSYINDLLKAVKCLCSYAFDEGYTTEHLTKKVKNVKEPKVLIHTFSDDEIVRMIQFYDGNDYLSIRNRLMLMMLFDTGLRTSEIIDSLALGLITRQTETYRRIKTPFINGVSLCVSYTIIFSSSVHPISILISESFFIKSTMHMIASIFFSPLPTQTSIPAPSIDDVSVKYP